MLKELCGFAAGISIVFANEAVSQIIPNGGHGLQPWTVGQTVDIRWTISESVHSLHLTLWDALGGEVINIAQNVDARLGLHQWRIPDTLMPHAWYRLLLHDALHGNLVIGSAGYIPVEGNTREALAKKSPIVATNQTQSGEAAVEPNPTSENAIVRWTSHNVERLVVRNVGGEVLEDISVRSLQLQQTLVCSDWPSGVYIIELHQEKLVQRLQLVVVQ